MVPAEDVESYLSLRSALDATNDCEGLPAGLVHPDGHIANSILTPERQVVLIDWDGAGQGPRVAALGLLVFASAAQAATDPSSPPDFGRVEAVLEGYLRHYAPSQSELARLPDAPPSRPLLLCCLLAVSPHPLYYVRRPR